MSVPGRGRGGPEEGAIVAVEPRSSNEATSLALALMEAGSETRPEPADSRELVRARGGVSSRVEQLLTQVLEKNRQLRMRLDQVETQSSWHSEGELV